MFKIVGKYAEALVTTMNIEEEAIAQVTELVNHPASLGSYISLMPDCHAGKGCVVGTTMLIKDRVVPNLVGVDIGCGVSMYPVPKEIDFAKLQKVIDKYVPSGMNVHQKSNEKVEKMIQNLKTPLGKSKSRILASLGTLGGGNHFLSIEGDDEVNYLLIHTGSRNLGLQVAKYHQDVAAENTIGNGIQDLIKSLKNSGQNSRIQESIELYKKEHADELSSNKELAFLEGKAMQDYLHDVKIAQEFATENRNEIARIIFKHMGWDLTEKIESVHNYIDTDEMILRKGAISCKGTFLVPLNMRDGTLVCYGESNPAWNDSAPHGAGRSMSRSRAKKELSLESFQETMKDIWSASVNEKTLDEAPDAYKPAEEIKALLQEQYTIQRHLKPLFNFKAQE